MPSVLILNQAELKHLVGVDMDALSAVEQAFTWLEQGKVAMPPVMHIDCGSAGDVDIKSAFVPGLPRFAVKLGAGFFGNQKLGLPNSPAMMVVLDSATGMTEAVLLDNAYLTDVRTGAAGAVAAKHLAPKQIDTVGIVGCGAQGRYQVRGLTLVRDFKRVLAYDNDAQALKRYVDDMGHELGLPVEPVRDLPRLVGQSQVVVTSTPAKTPYLKAEWLHRGLHITAMGADLPGKQELETPVLAAADLLVCDRLSQCRAGGELRHGFQNGLLNDNSPVVELGRLTSAQNPGRQSEDWLTICDLTGTGVQDTAIADLAVRRALKAGAGTQVQLGGE